MKKPNLIFVLPLFILLFLLSCSSSDSSKPKIGCIKGDCANGYGAAIWPNGIRYFGDWRNGRMHGFGTIVYPDGTQYTGDWRNGRIDGQGTMTMNNGVVRRGRWQNSKLVVADNVSRTGCIKGNCENGVGTRIWPNGTRYSGAWLNGQQHGQGALFRRSGDVVRGLWEKGKYAKAKERTVPKIVVTSPIIQENKPTTVNKEKIWIEGKASDDSGILKLLANKTEAFLVDDGGFMIEVALVVGENKVRLTAVDRNNNVAVKTLTIIRPPPTPQTLRDSIGGLAGVNYALIIGIGDYKHLPKIPTARHDVAEIEDILKSKYGFRIELLLDQGKQQILDTIKKYGQKLTVNDSLLIYYTGHGEIDESNGHVYWLPVDAESEYPIFSDSKWINTDSITAGMKKVSARHILIVADAAYAETSIQSISKTPFSSNDRNRFLIDSFQKSSRSLILSGKKGLESSSGDKDRSVFSALFIKGLKEMEREVFTAEELFFKHLNIRLLENEEQIPGYFMLKNSGHNNGDFVFVRVVQ